MSRGERSDLPLFDLQLHPDEEVGEEEEEFDVAQEASPAVAGHAVGRLPSQSRLFADDRDEDGSEAGDPESDEFGTGDDIEADVEERVDADEGVGALDRLVGGVIDLSIHLAVLLLVVAGTWVMDVGLSLVDWPAFTLFLLLFSLLYTGIPLAFWGQTPGMMRVGHVARTGSGEPLTFGQTARRWFGALLTLALAGLPLLLALGSGRSLADRLSGSYTEPA